VGRGQDISSNQQERSRPGQTRSPVKKAQSQIHMMHFKQTLLCQIAGCYSGSCTYTRAHPHPHQYSRHI